MVDHRRAIYAIEIVSRFLQFYPFHQGAAYVLAELIWEIPAGGIAPIREFHVPVARITLGIR